MSSSLTLIGQLIWIKAIDGIITWRKSSDSYSNNCFWMLMPASHGYLEFCPVVRIVIGGWNDVLQVTKKQMRKKALGCRSFRGVNYVPSARMCIWNFICCKLILFTLLLFAWYLYFLGRLTYGFVKYCHKWTFMSLMLSFHSRNKPL